MAQEDIISDYVDRSSVEEDTDFMLKNLNKIYDQLLKINEFKIGIQGTNSVKEIEGVLKQLAAAQEKIAALEKDILEQTKKSNEEKKKKKELTDEELRQELQLSEAKRKRVAELKNESREQQAAQGSIEQLRAALIRLQREYDNLSQTERESASGQEQKNKIAGLSAELKKLEGDTGRFQRNVGNYQGSAKIIVDALGSVEKKIENLREKQQGLMDLSKKDPIGFKLGNQADQLNQVTSELQQTTKQYEALNNITSKPQFLNLAGKVGDARTEIRGFTTTLIQLEQQGLGGTDFADSLRKHLADLTDQVADTKEEIKALSSDTRAFDQLSSSVNFLANSYQTFVGIQDLAGDQSEETQETLRKLVAVQAVANGLTEISEQLTKRGTIVNKAATFVQAQYALATNASATASARLAAATKLILPLAILGGIILLVTKLKEWGSATGEAARQSKLLSEVNKEVAKSAGQEIAQLDVLYKTATNTTLSIKERKKAVDELQEQYPEHFKNINDEIILQGKAAGAYNGAKEAILETAKARAIESKLAELSSKELDKIYEREEINRKKRQNDVDKRKADASKDDPETRGLLQFNAISEGSRLTKDLKDINADLEDIAADKEFLLNQITSAGVKTKPTPTANTKKPTDDAAEQIKKDLQAQFEAYRISKERQAALLKQSAEDEKNFSEFRILSLYQYIRIQQRLISEAAAFEISNNKHTVSEINLIRAKATDDQVKIALEGEKIIESINSQRIEAVKKMTALTVNEESRMYRALSDLANNFISTWKKQDDDEDERQKKRQASADKEKQRILDLRDAVLKLGEELKGLGFDLLSGSIEKEKNGIQEQIDLLEARKQKEIEGINQSLASQQDKAAQIAIIEARANAQHEALERRKRELDVQRARFERARAIADIIQSTTVAVIKTLAAYPGPAGITLAAVVGAIGAVQLARVLATPIPKYKEGTKDHKGGWAIVGDGGVKEFVETPDGNVFETPDKPTAVNLPKHSIVYSNKKELLEMQLKLAHAAVSRSMIPDKKIPEGLSRTDYMQGVRELKKEIKNQSGARLIMPNPLDIWMNTGKSWDQFNG